MQREKNKILKEDGGILYGPIAGASDEAQLSVIAIGFWSNSLTLAEFIHFFTSTLVNCGRGSEYFFYACILIIYTLYKIFLSCE